MSESNETPPQLPSPAGPRWYQLLGRGFTMLVVAAAAFGAGLAVQWAFSPVADIPVPGRAATQAAPARAHAHGGGGKPAAVTKYTCPMHPAVRLPDPDSPCPICGMRLIPVESSGGGSLVSTFSDTARALMNIETIPAERRPVSHTVRIVGKIDYDETRLSYITAWAPGRLDRLYVDYTGMPVRKGDHMVEIYSPELIAAQEEFIQASATARGVRADDSRLIRESAENNLQATRAKLRLLGLSPTQIAAVGSSGRASERITINAPIGGIVTERLAKQGQYVQTGARIYAIADLSEVWVRLEAYESDLLWLRYAQKVRFTTQAYPGRTFTGTVSFISPTMNEKTRTVQVRVNAGNKAGMLKPGMFVQAEVASDLNAAGSAIAPDVAGKWICPMHPEVIKGSAGRCDVCGMDLVTAESLGLVATGQSGGAPLTIPVSAVLQTGRRAVVYVEVPGAEKGTYEFRQVTLGPRAGARFVVLKGLKEGERVVVRGAFKIDSERQLLGLPSMMNPPPPGKHAHATSRPAAGARSPVVNVKCPIMGLPIDPAKVPDSLYRLHKGQGVGFCCGGCPAAWDKLSDAARDEKLRAVLAPGSEGH